MGPSWIEKSCMWEQRETFPMMFLESFWLRPSILWWGCSPPTRAENGFNGKAVICSVSLLPAACISVSVAQKHLHFACPNSSGITLQGWLNDHLPSTHTSSVSASSPLFQLNIGRRLVQHLIVINFDVRHQQQGANTLDTFNHTSLIFQFLNRGILACLCLHGRAQLKGSKYYNFYSQERREETQSHKNNFVLFMKYLWKAG